MGDEPAAGLPAGPLLHGVLDLCLLALLAVDRDYGYGLAQRLAAAGLGDVPGGTLYPALLRLERAGLVSAEREPSESGPPRKYYALTPDGHEELSRRERRWRAFTAGVDVVLARPEHRRRADSPTEGSTASPGGGW